jgi:hypothetical protein
MWHRTHQFFALRGYSGGHQRVIGDNPELLGGTAALTSTYPSLLVTSSACMLACFNMRAVLLLRQAWPRIGFPIHVALRHGESRLP